MILQEIHIDGFGIFNNFHLKNLGAGITLLSGENEAGKSSLLKFLRFTLFGYPKPTNQRMDPLNGGVHGGRLKILLSSGKEVLLERLSGKNGGPLQLHLDGKTLTDPVAWHELLGFAQGDLFNNVYAFSLDELMGLESLSTSEVEDKIFSAGMGLGKVSVSGLEETLLSQINNFYKPKGRTQILSDLIRNLNDTRNKIREIQNNLPRFRVLSEEILQQKEKIKASDKLLSTLRSEKERLDGYLTCYSHFISYNEAEEALKNLPPLRDYPGDGISRLDRLEEKENNLVEKLETLQTGTMENPGQLVIEKKINDLKFNAELLNNREKINFLRSNLERFKQVQSDYSEDEKKIITINTAIDEKLKEISGSWTEKDVELFSDLLPVESGLEKFKGSFEELSRQKEKLEDRQIILRASQRKVNTGTLILLTSLVFLIGSAMGFFYSLWILGGGMLLISFVLFAGRKWLFTENKKSELQEDLRSITGKETTLENQYKTFLSEKLHCKTRIDVPFALKILELIREIKREITNREEIIQKQNRERIPFIEKFRKEVQNQLKVLPGITAEESTEVLANRIIAAFDEAEKLYREKERLQDKLKEIKMELEATRQQLENIRSNIDSLLKTTEASGRDDFRKKTEQNNLVKKWSEIRNTAVRNMEEIVGYQQAEKAIDFLRSHSKEEITATVHKKENDLEELSQSNKEENTRLGAMNKELEQIENAAELSELLTDYESGKEKLKNGVRNWITAKLALKILSDVKQKYEKERQPEVLKNASAFLHTITEGRYNRIVASLDKKVVTVFDANEKAKRIEQLSRGTREQLLISLRLGFINEYEKQKEPLPLIMDEILVNFDPKRARQTTALLHQFAKNRQVLLFTCHPNTKNLFGTTNVNLINLIA